MSQPARFILDRFQFGELKKRIAEFGELSVDTFRYSTGVEAIELGNSVGSLVLLPYNGQQIWRCNFRGRELTMRSTFDEPTGSRDYLSTYGGFLLHCGATAMGVPGPEDTHPLHGDLPNAPYQSAEIVVGEKDGRRYLSVTGRYEYRLAFNYAYRATPKVTLREGLSVIDVEMEIENLRAETMPLMYMMHINFLPEDNAELVYSAPKTPEAVRVHNSVPGHMKSERIDELKAFMDKLETKPELHHVLAPEVPLDPEIVFTIDYLADPEGWAHTLLKYRDETSAYVSHQPTELPVGIRWLARKADEEAAGIVLPATAEHKGFTAELEKGNMHYLEGGASRSFHVRAGLLTADEIGDRESTIERILG